MMPLLERNVIFFNLSKPELQLLKFINTQYEI